MAHKFALSCVVFIASLISFAAMAISEEQCTYIVRVKTGTLEGATASTDSNISLKLNPSSDDSITISNLEDWGIMASGHNYFEAGNLDIFSYRGPCLRVCAINITSDNTGEYPSWYLEFVDINTVGCDKNVKMGFPVNQWLSLDKEPKCLYATVDNCTFKSTLSFV